MEDINAIRFALKYKGNIFNILIGNEEIYSS
jgi:hypothetical protein